MSLKAKAEKAEKIKIRPAREEDFSLIQKFNALLFRKEQKDFDPTLDINWPFSAEGERYFRRVLRGENGQAWLAIIDNQPVGYLAAVLTDEIPSSRKLKKRAILDNMFVLKSFRNRGAGSRLVQEFIHWAQQQGADNLRVTAFSGNKKALDFYRQNGFQDYNQTLEINFPSRKKELNNEEDNGDSDD